MFIPDFPLNQDNKNPFVFLLAKESNNTTKNLKEITEKGIVTSVSYFNKQQVEILSTVVHKLIQYTNEKQKRLTPCLLVSFADNLYKRFRPRSGPTYRLSLSFSKPFDTLISFLKDFFEKVHFEKISRRQKACKNTHHAIG